MSASTYLQALHIGVGRAAPGAGVPALLEPLLPPAQDASGVWLGLAALDLWQRAGFEAPPAPALGDASEAEDTPSCPPAAQGLLRAILQMEDRHLPEWLALANRHRCHLPPRFLPQLLDHGSRKPELRAAVAAVMGRRGAWLAARNPAWQWATGAGQPDSALFDSGTPEERTRALRNLRACDPAAGLALLSAGWASEPPEQRAALLPCLAVGLHADDEAFLEAALDDRRKEVRTAAQQLLAILPGSNYQDRARERVAGPLRIERNLLGMRKLQVTLPDEPDKAAKRDGVGAAAHPGLGEKAGWLADLLGAVSPLYWSEQWDLPPEDCLKLAAGTEFYDAVVDGWSAATVRHLPAHGAELAPWFHALTRLWLAERGPRARYPRGFFLAARHLPVPERERHLQELVKHGPTWTGNDLAAMAQLKEIAGEPGAAWSAALSLQLMDALRLAITHWNRDWEIATAMNAFALALDPLPLASYEQGWPTGHKHWEQWERPIGEFLHTLRLRHKLITSFQESSA